MHDFWKRYAGDFLALLAVAAVVGLFFFRLFWPEPQLVVTPDFGRSDAWHFSFATKLALWESLKRGELPLWESRMGMGFPLFAEGQVGALFLPNLLLFKVIDNPVVAYNASYVVLFLILGWGMYAWLRVIGCSQLPSLFGAITIVFSGQTIPRLPHHTLLESFSMSPLILALAHQVLTKKHVAWISLFAFAVSAQLFTGSPQPVLLALLMIGIYAVMTPHRLGRIILGVVLAVGIAAIQLLPSAEMLRESTSPKGFSPEEASYYSFPLVHLKTLVAPFVLGNPKLGTYPPFTTFDGSIFWENNLFVGWLPLLFLLLSFARPPLAKLRVFFLISLAISFFLMLGKHSPLYLLYSVWPLSFFRVPSRFAWIFILALVSLASQAISKLPRFVVLPFLIFQTVFLSTTWWNYHAIEPARTWLTPSPFIQTINGSIRTIGSELVHNRQFLKNGWNANADFYRFLRSVPAPNSNLYWSLTQTDVYAGRFLKRPALVETILGNEIKLSEEVATISAQGKRLLDLYHAGIIVSALPLDMEKPMAEIASTKSSDLTITAYQNPDALPRVYLVNQTVFTPTLTKAAEALTSNMFTPGKTAIIHSDAQSLREVGTAGGDITITDETPTRVTMRADVYSDQTILVFGDTYYPGWQATIDGHRINIFPVNIKERGIFVSKGSHEIVWQYQPRSFELGFIVTIVSTIITILLIVF